MKTIALAPEAEAAPIVQLAEVDTPPLAAPVDLAALQAAGALPRVVPEMGALQRARAFAEPLLSGHLLDTGEPALAHADGVAGILEAIGAAPTLRAAAYLVYAADFLQRPEEVVRNAFGESYAGLVEHTRKLVAVQRAAREAPLEDERRELQTERVRKMLLAFSRDLRVVLLRLASRLQTLRWFAAAKQPCAPALALESQQVFAPLANRLGIWQIKWELEDLAFRFLQPAQYARLARQLDETRARRELAVNEASERLRAELATAGIEAQVQGRPKHLFSIWKKMQGKGVDLASIYDLRALRVIVRDVPACYAALACVHARWHALPDQYDDYIARPKANGYQSLHTVVLDDDGHALEVQIRTRAMHEHAEYGVAAHWAYKEAGARGYAGGVSAAGEFEGRIAAARKAVLRQLLAWERDHAAQVAPEGAPGFDDRIFVFTPQATVIELPAGATPVDFAYALHTDLGHRCRGARVDGAMVPLNTALANGQTVEITAAKDGGPSLDWLNAELGFLRSPRARAKVRAWFNARAQAETIARGRELVEKLLQRKGRTALERDELAARLGFKGADALFEVVGKDELSLRTIEALLEPAPPPPAADAIALRRTRANEGGVLVVGVESLMTTLARCCRPAPPDAIGGYVTRGKGVAIHRSQCSNYRQMLRTNPERAIAVAWGARPAVSREAVYPVTVRVEAQERTGLLRDISELLAKERMNVTAVQTQTTRGPLGALSLMELTVELDDASRLTPVLAQIVRIAGVRSARRG